MFWDTGGIYSNTSTVTIVCELCITMDNILAKWGKDSGLKFDDSECAELWYIPYLSSNLFTFVGLKKKKRTQILQ
jgi:hypothetical protein